MLAQTLSRITAVTAAATLAGMASPASADLTGFNGGTGYTANAKETPGPTFTATTATLTQLGTQYQAVSVFSNTKQDISTGFTAQFTYRLTAVGSSGYTDGFTFLLQNAGLGARGGDGGGLGFQDIASSVAVAFDQNQGSPRREITKIAVGPGYSDLEGARPNAPLAFASQHPIRVTLAYSAAAGTLTETLVDQTNLATFSTTYTGLNIADSVGGSSAYVGFTAGTLGTDTTGTQTISDFSFTVVPEPASLAAIAVGGLLLGRRRAAG